MSNVPRLPNFIAGRCVEAEATAWHSSRNPSKPDDVVAEVPESGFADVGAAVQGAVAAQAGWWTRTGMARADALYAWADALKARAEELAGLIAREVGKPIGEARGEVGRGVLILRYYAGEAVREAGDVIPSQIPGALQYSQRRPVGVCGLITPWNFPVAIPLWKAAPALAFGNTVVLKPSELSGAVAALLAETAEASGLPAGVFNVVHGAGETGSALVAHPDVAAISFTGSAKVGGLVASACATRNAKFQTEMGGKNVGIVLADADLDRAANLIAGGAMRCAGQKCTATGRVVVERSVRDALLPRLKAAVEALPLGPVSDPMSAIGPLISLAARERVEAAIAGAPFERLTGGPIQDDRFREGYFVKPTVFTGVDPGSPLAQEELFGPVLAVIEADDFDHAIALANQTRYGLSASLYTQNLAKALSYADRIEVGLVRVNGDTTGVDPHAPFGGLKGSSSHSREQGPAARDFYTDVKTVQISG
ncbi:MAG: aldehyde dehydrogenase family protein [Fimbriimonadaceae bacterium]|nr:aldehyde dehydrogenase family protein [Fimbriimonadaceae bacterium]